MTDYRPLLDFARHLAQETTALIMPHFYNCVAEFKSDGSEVTEADRSAERRMRDLIHAAFPQHRVLGEEYGITGPEQTDFQWILDPVDGTHWLPLGVPTFGTLIGLLEKGKPVVGVIAFPAMREVVLRRPLAWAAGMPVTRWTRSECRSSSSRRWPDRIAPPPVLIIRIFDRQLRGSR